MLNTIINIDLYSYLVKLSCRSYKFRRERRQRRRAVFDQQRWWVESSHFSRFAVGEEEPTGARTTSRFHSPSLDLGEVVESVEGVEGISKLMP